ncbi:hypothetical protein Nepgr_005001 [Nepenthes gracilis]|uniref:Hydroxyproline-rich glycoprotein family protein n=1 Tax=Nepenthes gracilis TaxID=150966 RepID=A0AAD3XG07_NEPGR|nr:hypothetical protein Nepgr_005001 [Nepenthes gracilis]
MAFPKDPTPPPPPVIGKIGPYTVFLTPPSTPSPKPANPIPETPKKAVFQPPLPPVQPPPAQFIKPAEDRLEFLRNAVAKFQKAHSSLDHYVANWLGLNHSKYQWALDDYYESKGVEKGDSKTKEVSSA